MDRVVALDFDGVIADTGPAKRAFARDVLGITVNESQVTRGSFIEIFGVEKGRRLYSDIIESLYNSELMLSNVFPVRGARQGMSVLRARGWRCVVITSRHGGLALWAWRFLEFHEFAVTSTDFFHVDDQSKLPICVQVNAEALVEDDYMNLMPVIDAGIKGYLLTSEVNITDEQKFQPFRATRVNDWNELLDNLLDLKDQEEES